MSLNQIICGDSIQILKTFPRRFVDITITSPPFNLNKKYDKYNDNILYSDYLTFTKEWLKEVLQVSKITGRLCLDVPLDVNLGGHHSFYVDIANIVQEVGWKYKVTIIWNKTQITGRTAWGSWQSPSAPSVTTPVEMIGVFYKEKWKRENIKNKISDITKEQFIEWTYGVWTFPYKSSKEHPAAFPEEVPKRLLKLFSFRDDVVLDPFNGIGTTCIVAKELQRKYIGIDISEEYCKIAERRVNHCHAQMRI